MKDFQMLTLCFTFLIALYKINSLTLWEGQPFPGLDSGRAMGVSAHTQELLATFPAQIRQQPTAMWKAVKLISRTLVSCFNTAAFKSCIVKPVMH